MSDELDALRRLRPDRVLPDDPIDPEVLTRERSGSWPASLLRPPSIA